MVEAINRMNQGHSRSHSKNPCQPSRDVADCNDTDQEAESSEDLTKAEDKLELSQTLDFVFRVGVHGSDIEIAIGNNQVLGTS